MQIRCAKIEDIPQICELLNVLFSQEVEFISDKNKQENGLKMIIDNPILGDILIVSKDDKIVAMLNLLYTISTALGAKVAILEDMIVTKEVRKDGVGSKLLKYAIEFAKNKECQRITLLTDNNNLVAHNFYKKNGFTSSTMIPFRISLIEP